MEVLELLRGIALFVGYICLIGMAVAAIIFAVAHISRRLSDIGLL